jgi:glycosyltransferase involved in cell wall biosynthesis
VYYAADAERVAVVQTLHNYRLLCPSAVCFRDGHVCTDCLGKPVAWPAIRHACYRGSRSATAAVVTMLSVHRLLGTWHQKTSVYIVLTELARRLFMRAGLPADKLVLKPNFVEPDPGLGTGGGGYAIFVGRLSSEKGITVLLDAWRRIGGRIPLRIVGDGPLSSLVAEAAVRIPGVTWLGRQTREEIASLVGDAACLVFPSECYETFGRVIVEAFAGGTPVLAADHGAGGELVSDGITGLLFRHGDAHDLADKVIQLMKARPRGRGYGPQRGRSSRIALPPPPITELCSISTPGRCMAEPDRCRRPFSTPDRSGWRHNRAVSCAA